MGDLYRALGQGELARDAFLKALGIRERLAASEPDRADYQRDLSVSYIKMGDLYSALGQGELARDAFLKALGIRERLAASEPDRADYQRDLVVSLVRIAIINDPAEIEHLIRALLMLESLKITGRLAPVDEPMITAIQSMISSESDVS
jgi:tetratricopeptide (TPR) repeat protein